MCWPHNGSIDKPPQCCAAIVENNAHFKEYHPKIAVAYLALNTIVSTTRDIIMVPVVVLKDTLTSCLSKRMKDRNVIH